MSFTFPFQNSLLPFSNFNQFQTTYIQSIHNPTIYQFNMPYSNYYAQIEQPFPGNNSTIWYASSYQNTGIFYQAENLIGCVNQGIENYRNQPNIMKNQDKQITNTVMDNSQAIVQKLSKKIHKIQRKQSTSTEKVFKFSKKRIYKQSPNRNVITNIGNKMITFLLSKKRNLHIIKKLNPNWKQAQIKHFYDYVKKIKRELGYYLNLQKMQNIWYRDSCQKYFEFQILFRKLSHHYLTNIFVSAILSSTRIELESKIRHLKSRRILVNKLRLSEDTQL